MSQTAIPCTVMRGGTSKGLYFLAADLPSDVPTRNAVLLAAMGSPDVREIDGMGGGHPLTSKVAVVSPSEHEDVDVDYLFLQVWPDRPEVSDQQNCGNLLAGVGPFAIEEGLVSPEDGKTTVRIWMQNTKSRAAAVVETPGGVVRYDGDARIDGVPGTHAPIPIEFFDTVGSSCGALLPTGQATDEIEHVRVTCIDNGMPVVCVRASDLGVSGYEDPTEIEANNEVRRRVEEIRLAAGELMRLGNVTSATVPKVSLLAPGKHGGVVATRTFIPHRVHEAIGVFGAVSVATACLVPGSVANDIAGIDDAIGLHRLDIEHPSGYFTVDLDVHFADGTLVVDHVALLRTARRLMRGEVFIPASVWRGQ